MTRRDDGHRGATLARVCLIFLEPCDLPYTAVGNADHEQVSSFEQGYLEYASCCPSGDHATVDAACITMFGTSIRRFAPSTLPTARANDCCVSVHQRAASCRPSREIDGARALSSTFRALPPSAPMRQIDASPASSLVK